MWLVEYSAIAEHYVDSNLPYTVGVVRAVLRLMMSNDGQPTEGCSKLSKRIAIGGSWQSTN